MNRLWAPWRAKYIREVADKSPEKCFLCEAARMKNPEEAFVLEFSKHSFVILNIYPYNTGHLMVVPLRHIANLEELTEEEHADLGITLARCIKAIKKAYSPHGINIGMNLGRAAGAGLESHIHYHVVPRWNGDTNFMPVIAETKVVSEMLDDTFRKLKEALIEI
ncbi:MAG: HIT domain-containing protein [Actinobacteria bacterium]|nr:HIT domain-containing protein [Actinomycetota bacterium]